LDREERLRHAIKIAILDFKKTPAGKELTDAEILRSVFTVWHEFGEHVLRVKGRIENYVRVARPR
jgi:hypothetical protein